MTSRIDEAQEQFNSELTAETDWLRRAEFRAKARQSLYFFTKVVICYSFHTAAKPNLMTGRTFLESCNWIWNVMTKYKRGLFEDPRAHIKSYRTTISLPPFIAVQKPHDEHDTPEEYDRAAAEMEAHPHLRGPDTRIGIASEAKSTATEWSGAVREHFRTNPVFRWAFPEFTWDNENSPEYGTFARESFFIPGREDPTESNPFVRAIGLGSKESGKRVDVLLIDDLVSEDSARSQTELHRRCEWIKSISQLLENSDYTDKYGGVVMVTENRWALDDPNTMIHRDMDHWHIWRRSAHRCYVHGFGNCGRWSGEDDTDCAEMDDGIWPERYPDLDAVRRDKGDIIYDIQWRNNPRKHPELDASKFVPFRLDLRAIQQDDGKPRRKWCVVVDEVRGEDGETVAAADVLPIDQLKHYISIDPASADEESEARKRGKTARTCITWFGFDPPTGRVFTIDVAAGHWTPDTSIDEAYKTWFAACEKLGQPVKVLYEKVAAQTYAASALKLRCQQDHVPPPVIEGIRPARGLQKEHRIRQRTGLRLGQYKLYLREGLQLPRSEVIHFPQGTKDWLDTEAQAEEKFLEHHGASSRSTRAAKRRKRRRKLRIRSAGITGVTLG